jgi:hypothetical protein
MKFGLDCTVEFNNSFELYYQILARVLMKVAVNFIYFAYSCTKVSKMQLIFNKNLKSVWPNLVKIFWPNEKMIVLHKFYVV